MGVAWMPDDRGDAFGDMYRDDYRTVRRYYRSAASWTGFRNPAGRHALSHSQRPLLAGFAATRMPLGRSRSVLPGSRQTPGVLDRPGREESGGRGAHAARLPDLPRRATGWSGPERWRRWA